jgi:hypothetical protein
VIHGNPLRESRMVDSSHDLSAGFIFSKGLNARRKIEISKKLVGVLSLLRRSNSLLVRKLETESLQG